MNTLKTREPAATLSSQRDADTRMVETGTDRQSKHAATGLSDLILAHAAAGRNDTRSAFFFAFVAVAASVLTAHLPVQNVAELMSRLAAVAIATVLGGCVMIGLAAHRSRRRRRRLEAALHDTAPVEAVGPLVRLLQSNPGPERTIAKHSLTRILQRLRESDSARLTASDRAILLRILDISPSSPYYYDLREMRSPSAFRRECDFCIAILKSYEQIGGDKELATVQRIVKGGGTAYTMLPMPENVRAAAAECLPSLKTRVAEAQATRHLLRPAASPSAADELLHPVQAIPYSEAAMLVRPVEMAQHVGGPINDPMKPQAD